MILAIDTCLAACGCAIGHVSRIEPMSRGHAERLAPLVAEVAAEAKVAFEQIERIGVAVGPGSFTGLRVGLAFARAMATALRIPCLGVSTLEALAGEGEGVRAGVIEAPLAGVYLAAYEHGRAIVAPRRASIEEAAQLLPPDAVVRGPGAHLLAGLALRVERSDSPDPAFIARLVASRDAADAPPRPQYLREPDAKLPA